MMLIVSAIQVANFYNTVGLQMLECHKPCLIQYAKVFEELILNPKDRQNRPITWDNAATLDNYMVRSASSCVYQV